MRIVAIGLGGAGCRIVDSLYSTDRKSSKVACIQGLAVDVDEKTLKQLTALPESSRLYFPAMDPEISNQDRGTEPTVSIDINDILSRIHNIESGETDAIFICLGLGGGMADIAPHVITSLRSSLVEPVFGLVTLPCLAEGEKHSAKAADDIDILSPLLDGMILFDNETWYKKTKALRVKRAKKEKGFADMLGLAQPEPELSPELATYQLLNEGIVRRISLILRAGEFRADGGIDLAEVVLDSGEVINTMKGMGFITIGYAVERLPSNPLAFLSQFRPKGVFEEENKKKASRIVDLAKQAIYHEISTPCDMTSAHKALVLIAGPSHELSMKGFMTVRKWIDRSIAGLETRSGDYPILNTKNVAIIIMLSGLENIPRVGELREIRAQYSSWSKRRTGESTDFIDDAGAGVSTHHGTIRDEMIVMPVGMRKAENGLPHQQELPMTESADHPQKAGPAIREHALDMAQIKRKIPTITEYPTTQSQVEATLSGVEMPQKTTRHRVIVSNDAGSSSQTQTQAPKLHTHQVVPKTVATTPVRETGITQGPGISPPGSKDAARQRIERELQKQRLKAMAGRGKQAEVEVPVEPPSYQEPIRKRHEIHMKPATPLPVIPDEKPVHEQRTVIISKRKLVSRPVEPSAPDTERVESTPDDGAGTAPTSIEQYPLEEDNRDLTVVIKDTQVRAKDRVFEGREIQKPKTALAKDAPLIHTSLKPKTQAGTSRKDHPAHEDETHEPDQPEKKQNMKGKKPEDISWI
ncbi:MAG: hypothetical protein M0Q92_06725 [Methanoregula sp.]|jgi:cell division GTPase FtsZ|nr:hypothetical protein [Methanoregula sp.]